MKDLVIKKSSTVFLKVALVVMSIGVLGLCIIMFVGLAGEGIRNLSYFDRLLSPLVLIMYITAIPFYVAVIQAWKLLNYVDKNIAFSELSIKALKHIKYCAFTVSILYVSALPQFYNLAQADDAPGVMLIGFIFVGASFTVAIFAAVLQKLIESAMALKTENDLTV